MTDEPTNPDHLPDDPGLLKAIVRELLAANRDLQRRHDQLDLQLKRVYGPRADQLPLISRRSSTNPHRTKDRRHHLDPNLDTNLDLDMVDGNCPRTCDARPRSLMCRTR